VNGLGTVMRFLSAGAAGCASLGAAQVFGAWQFIAGIVDHFKGPDFGSGVGAETCNLPRKNHDDEQQERLQQPGSEHAPVREKTVGSFPGQARARAGKGRTNRSDELLPG
jgi:hypothetical protein